MDERSEYGARVVACRAVDIRDLRAVTTFHIYGNYYHATQIRGFSMLRYMHHGSISI